jgi:dsDNA-specific endonuclease/ATPase MutS2
MALRAGDAVQTPLGKGVVREARKNGRVVVEVRGRSVVLDERTVTPFAAERAATPRKRASPGLLASDVPDPRIHGAPAEVDLHGLTIVEALARVEQAVNDALLADLPELRVIHGQSGGRLRASLHRWLRGISTIRTFRIDSRNAGVTIISF